MTLLVSMVSALLSISANVMQDGLESNATMVGMQIIIHKRKLLYF